MNVHEYQAKEILSRWGVSVPRGKVAFTPEEAERVAEEVGGVSFVVKAQIHAGGRGKAGGIRRACSPQEVREVAAHLLGKYLVTPQTGPQGKRVEKVLVAEAVSIRQEFYFALTLDRGKACVALIASREGGVEIEAVAAERPEAILREVVDPAVGLFPFQVNRLAYRLGMETAIRQQFVSMGFALYRAFLETDALLVEINPLALTEEGRLLALDAKMSFDDNALYRHPEIAALRDPSEEDPRERIAREQGLSYVGLGGNIGCMVNGAGLAMATMDLIQYYGGEPANFLDVGGTADASRVAAAFRLILSDPHVRVVWVNIFGGIVKCDVIAQGILDALREVPLRVPLVVRLEGTNVEQGRQMLEASGLNVLSARGLDEAAKKAVAVAKRS